MKTLLFIFVGGGFGSLCRYQLNEYLQKLFKVGFPIGILVVNVLASLILGIFIGLEINKNISTNYRFLVAVGFCGGFSTFSTFSSDTLKLIQTNRYTEAGLSIILNVTLCLIATGVGIYITRNQ